MKIHDLSYIEPNEELEAKNLIESSLGFPPPRPCGYHLAVRIYVRDENLFELKDENGNPRLDSNGKKLSIVLPDTVRADDKFRKCAALVLSIGPDAYKGERFKYSGPWCRVGDWVIIPRNEGVQIDYRGIPVQFLPDDRVLGIIEDPTHVQLY